MITRPSGRSVTSSASVSNGRSLRRARPQARQRSIRELQHPCALPPVGWVWRFPNARVHLQTSQTEGRGRSPRHSNDRLSGATHVGRRFGARSQGCHDQAQRVDRTRRVSSMQSRMAAQPMACSSVPRSRCRAAAATPRLHPSATAPDNVRFPTPACSLCSYR